MVGLPNPPAWLSTTFASLYARAPLAVWTFGASLVLFTLFITVYTAVVFVAPLPRPPFASEITYRTVDDNGQVTERRILPCWLEEYLSQKEREKEVGQEDTAVEDADLFMSVVVPAYNEEKRLEGMLEEAVDFLNSEYGSNVQGQVSGLRQRKKPAASPAKSSQSGSGSGWEILVISDGSNDKTEAVALDYAKRHQEGSIRVVGLQSNRGKGGAVAHGMRHVRGEYTVFCDADGASKFADLAKLVSACQKAEDSLGRGVAIGSRAHLVGSAAVVNRSTLRNFLMHGFHLFIWLFTPQQTSTIRDTQCGFKLFSRATLPYIVPHMHAEGWIFDVEMLMLAERAGIPMVEVPVGWHEVKGSKLNVLRDSFRMGWDLAVLRVAWAFGVYEEPDMKFDPLKVNENAFSYKLPGWIRISLRGREVERGDSL